MDARSTQCAVWWLRFLDLGVEHPSLPLLLKGTAPHHPVPDPDNTIHIDMSSKLLEAILKETAVRPHLLQRAVRHPAREG